MQKDNQKTGWCLKERAFIIEILMLYERVYYHFKQTNWWLYRDHLYKKRHDYLKTLLNEYFCERLLTNPRILGFVERYFDENVKTPSASAGKDCDGPFR
jgi:hypothetical protein